MLVKNYPLNFSTWGQEELLASTEVIQSGYCTSNNVVIKFEDEFKTYFGSKFAVYCNSGSSANLLAIASLFFRKNNPLKVGDEIIVPAVSWSTTYFPLSQYGLKIKFVDVNLDTFNLDIEEVKAAVGPKTKGIFAVNLLGNPNDFDNLLNICEENKLILLEDNCESMGALYKGRYCGTFGALGTFSTFFSHHINTVEGGVILTDSEELYQIMLSLRSHGWTRNLPKNNHICDKSDDEFKESFRFYLPGYNLRANEIFAAIGIEQLKKLHGFVNQRIINLEYLQNKLQDKDIKLQKTTENSVSSSFGFGFLFKDRDLLVSKLKEKNIECRPIVAGNFIKNPVLNFLNYEIHGEMKNADIIDSDGIYVGNSHLDMSNYIDYFLDTIK